MKYSFVLLITMSSIITQAQEDFANLQKFQKENKQLDATPNSGQRTVFLGDSIFENWMNIYPEFFTQQPNYINRAISGQTTSQMLLRFQQDVVALHPKQVILLAGTNDIAGNTGYADTTTISNNIISMCQLAKANHIQVVICSVLPAKDYPWRTGLYPAEKIVLLNTALKDYAYKNKIPYCDLHTSMSDADGGIQTSLAFDGVHPNKAGYLLMEKLLKPYLK